MRPVDAMGYRKVLEEELKFHRDCNNREIVQGLEIAIADLGDMPTVEVRPVVHAKWIMDEYTHQYRCSHCKRVQPYDACNCGDHDNPIYDYWDCNFCPECGAIMDLESEGKDE